MNIELKSIFDYLEKANLKYKYYGKTDILINRYSSLNNIKSKSITWVKNQSYFKEELLVGFEDIILVINSDVEVKVPHNEDLGFIICDNPKKVFFSILNEFFKQQDYKSYISPNSVVETKLIGKNVYMGHNCYIGKDVKIGNNVVIKNNVSIEGKVEIGDNTILHSGVIIGTDGYGYYQNNEGKNMKVPHYGGVVIGNDVEIGANTCIDRGTLDDTVIGNNVKISNLCHIAHNVKIHGNCLMTAGVVITGSTVISKNTYIAPGAIIKNQLTIGENSLVGMGAVVIKDVEKDKVVVGVPARVIRSSK